MVDPPPRSPFDMRDVADQLEALKSSSPIAFLVRRDGERFDAYSRRVEECVQSVVNAGRRVIWIVTSNLRVTYLRERGWETDRVFVTDLASVHGGFRYAAVSTVIIENVDYMPPDQVQDWCIHFIEAVHRIIFTVYDDRRGRWKALRGQVKHQVI